MQEKGKKISPIKERILLFAKNKGISKRNFYLKIGVSRGTLEASTGITEDIVAKFITAYPEVDIIWLITGNGNMLKDDNKEQEVPNEVSDKEQEVPISAERVLVDKVCELSGEIAVLKQKNEELKRENAQLKNGRVAYEQLIETGVSPPAVKSHKKLGSREDDEKCPPTGTPPLINSQNIA
ncbi:hypothetical protein Barb6XT_02379 [Bacteroidales bacterium Barb6XT]|nr:hypothetical protein Barb6XT_02379 [Bacteroidales bacterium Barb6XT]